MRRVVAILAGLVLTGLLLAPASAVAAPGAVTFHGTFSGGEGWWTAAGPDPVIVMPVTGDWNLNVNMNLAPDQGRAKGVVVVRYVGGGLHALWTPSAVDLQPLTEVSPLASFIPELAGVVNAPPAIYAYTAHLAFLDSTMVFYYEPSTGTFFYAAENGAGFTCPPPSDEVPFCMDRLRVSGAGGR